jgi:hypothetical protein
MVICNLFAKSVWFCEVPEPDPEKNSVFENGNFSIDSCLPTSKCLSPNRSDCVDGLVSNFISSNSSAAHETKIFQTTKLGVDLARGRTPIEEVEDGVGPILDVIAGELAPKTENSENGPCGCGDFGQRDIGCF